MSDLVAFLRARLAEDTECVRSMSEDRDSYSLALRELLPPHLLTQMAAEVGAKRRIIAWASQWPLRPPRASDGIAAEDRLLRILAQPYADHPDFDPEWKL